MVFGFWFLFLSLAISLCGSEIQKENIFISIIHNNHILLRKPLDFGNFIMRWTTRYTGAYPMSHAQAVYNFVHPIKVSLNYNFVYEKSLIVHKQVTVIFLSTIVSLESIKIS